MELFQIALDGPAGVGKSTIAKVLSQKLGVLYLETGALYRSIAYNSIKLGLEPIKSLEKTNIQVKFENNLQQVYVNDLNVTSNLRTEQISMEASNVSKIPEVRNFLLDLQRDIPKNQSVIMDGRDIGTVILPNATIKIFLKASAEVRAQRRFNESVEDLPFEKILEDIILRDEQDTNRDVAPLKPAHDAVIIDTSNMTIEESVDEIIKILKTKIEV